MTMPLDYKLCQHVALVNLNALKLLIVPVNFLAPCNFIAPSTMMMPLD